MTSGKADPGHPTSAGHRSLEQAIAAMRANRPLRAEELCRDYLVQHPGSVGHLRVLGHALMKQDRLPEAESQLQLALSLQPDLPQLYEDLGNVLAIQQRYQAAIENYEQALRLDPTLQLARKKLAHALAAIGRGAEADAAFLEYFDQDPDRQAVAEGVEWLRVGRRDDAIARFREILGRSPDNVDAMRFLAMALGQDVQTLDDAEALLRRATKLAPDYAAAHLNLGMILTTRGRRAQAIDAFLQAVRLDGDNDVAWAGLGNAYAVASQPEKAVEAYARATALNPANANAHIGHAHVLKAVGELPAAVTAYRTAIRTKPDAGEAYWSLANLKTFRFEDEEVRAMERHLAQGGMSASTEVHFRFALGKACEDGGDIDRAWHYYHSGNQKQRQLVSYDPLEMERQRTSIIDVFSAEYLGSHADCGYEAQDPILIVGLPRSGSTLIEQILASHSQVEGTAELPNLGTIATSIGRYRSDRVSFPEAVRDLSARQLRAFGKQYIDETRRYRETERPFFTDKLPNNFPLVGFLHVICPHAKVIDARRHPLDSLLGNYKQLYGKGQDFTYDLVDLAEYYRQYDRIMKHWDEVLPGKVLRVHYEETVLDLEGQVRRILAHCGLPFEDACLRYYENERSVKTPSSEQVRRPIYTSALGTWRKYDRYLGYWQEELADILAELPPAVKNAGLAPGG